MHEHIDLDRFIISLKDILGFENLCVASYLKLILQLVPL